MANKLNVIVNKKNLFIKTIEDAKSQNFGYIGTGNVHSNILIIGKEVAIGLDNPMVLDQYENNQSLWIKDIDKTIWDVQIRNLEAHSPVCPYKGQYLKIDNGKNWGTSRTWFNYQKLHNYIYGDSYERINFHKDFFITEVNSSPSPKTINAEKNSVTSRKAFIANSEYFQSFQIVILAGLGYYDISDNHNDIEHMFNVKFKEQRFAGKSKSNPYWIHWNEDKTKIVINTIQLSMFITNSLLEELGDVIKNSKIEHNRYDTDESATLRWKNFGSHIHNSLEENPEFEKSDEYKDYMTWV